MKDKNDNFLCPCKVTLPPITTLPLFLRLVIIPFTIEYCCEIYLITKITPFVLIKEKEVKSPSLCDWYVP